MQIASYRRHVSKQRAVAVAADGGAAPAPPSSRAAAVATEAVAAGGVAATNQHGHNFARNTPWKKADGRARASRPVRLAGKKRDLYLKQFKTNNMKTGVWLSADEGREGVSEGRGWGLASVFIEARSCQTGRFDRRVGRGSAGVMTPGRAPPQRRVRYLPGDMSTAPLAQLVVRTSFPWRLSSLFPPLLSTLSQSLSKGARAELASLSLGSKVVLRLTATSSSRSPPPGLLGLRLDGGFRASAAEVEQRPPRDARCELAGWLGGVKLGRRSQTSCVIVDTITVDLFFCLWPPPPPPPPPSSSSSSSSSVRGVTTPPDSPRLLTPSGGLVRGARAWGWGRSERFRLFCCLEEE